MFVPSVTLATFLALTLDNVVGFGSLLFSPVGYLIFFKLSNVLDLIKKNFCLFLAKASYALFPITSVPVKSLIKPFGNSTPVMISPA